MDENGAGPSDSAAAMVSSVGLRLPPFWPADPQLWFAQVESQFSTRRITLDMTKFHYVVSSLSPEVATEVRDLLITPPTTEAYETLKTQLIRRTGASQEKRLQQLLTAEELGDRTPTQLLRRMEQLLGEKATTIDASLLRELFLQRLPATVRMVLASAGDIGIAKLAELADKIMEVTLPVISAVRDPTPREDARDLRAEVSRLADAVAALQQQHRSRRSDSRGRSPTPSRRPSRERDGTCWYHHKFGNKARKCTPPCTKSTGNEMPQH